jgi:hypothetical protein
VQRKHFKLGASYHFVAVSVVVLRDGDRLRHTDGSDAVIAAGGERFGQRRRVLAKSSLF